MDTLVIATTNKGKVADFKTLFAGMYEIKSLLDYPDIPEIEEDGLTFQENAAKKAETLAQRFKQTVIADDSGLVVDALDGRPGVFSARYAGEPKNDQANLDKVLEELKGVSTEERTARFFCTIALASPNEQTTFYEGACEGIITKEPLGENGFGYDPIFFLPDFNATMAQVSLETKNKMSHRARAIAQLKKALIR